MISRKARPACFLVLLTVLAFAASGQAQGSETKAKPLPVVTTIQAQRMPISSSFDATGSVEAARIAKLASPAEGPILNCKVREGDYVRQGDVLFKIGRTKSAEALLASASEDLRKEEEEARRIEHLVRNGAIAGDQLGVSRASLQKAKAQAVKVRESLEDYNVAAPWAGLVSKVLVTDGNFVSPRTPLIEIYDPTSLVLRFAAPEAQAAGVKQGMVVEFHLDAYPGKTLQAKVSRIYPELDRRMRTLTLEAAPEGKLDLIPGMFARLRVTTKIVPEATVISARSVIITPAGDQVAFVIREGKAEARKVALGVEGREQVEVLAGVAPGEAVVVEGAESLKNGAQVKVSGAASDAASSSGK